MILNVSGPGGVGKSMLLRTFRRIALERGRPVVLADGATFPATPAGLLHALGGAQVEEVLATLNATRPLLLLDGYAERGSPTLWLHKQLLARLESSVKVVIAGRARLELLWHQEEGWRTLIHPLPLTALAPAECRAYLARRGLHAPTVVEQIVHATAGHPWRWRWQRTWRHTCGHMTSPRTSNGTWSRARWWRSCCATSQTRGCGRRWRPVRWCATSTKPRWLR